MRRPSGCSRGSTRARTSCTTLPSRSSRAKRKPTDVDPTPPSTRSRSQRSRASIRTCASCSPESLRPTVYSVTTCTSSSRWSLRSRPASPSTTGSYVAPATRRPKRVVTEAGTRVEERNRALRHRFSVTSVVAVLLAVFCTAIGVLLINRTRRARAKAEGDPACRREPAAARPDRGRRARRARRPRSRLDRLGRAPPRTDARSLLPPRRVAARPPLDAYRRGRARAVGYLALRGVRPLPHLPEGDRRARSAPARTRCPDARSRPATRSGSTRSPATLSRAPVPPALTGSRPRSRFRSSPTAR